MKDFIIRNKPIFIIGIVTVLVFILLIVMGQKNPPASPYLINVERNELVTDYSPTIGNDGAAFVLVEFSDFQCPACKGYEATVKELTEKNPEDLKFIYRHFPLVTIHPNARPAAIASMAANKQGMFFEYAAKLFEDQENLGPDKYQKIAQELQLDMEKFNNELNDGDSAKEVQKDMENGVRLGLNSTPTFFLNGKLLQVRNPRDLSAKVQKEIDDLTPEKRKTQEEARKELEARPQVMTTREYKNRIEEYKEQNTEVAEISYTGEEFEPGKTNVTVGTTVKWTNNSSEPISLTQNEDYYDNFNSPVEIEPGQSLSLKVTHDKLWTYFLDGTDVYGMVYSYIPPELSEL